MPIQFYNLNLQDTYLKTGRKEIKAPCPKTWFSTKIEYNDIIELKNWLEDVCEYRYHIHHLNNKETPACLVSFESLTDSVQFKLMW